MNKDGSSVSVMLSPAGTQHLRANQRSRSLRVSPLNGLHQIIAIVQQQLGALMTLCRTRNERFDFRHAGTPSRRTLSNSGLFLRLAVQNDHDIDVRIDAGIAARMLSEQDAADLLIQAGVAHADGFFLNVSNYRLTEHLAKYLSLIGFLIDLRFGVAASAGNRLKIG